MERIDYNSFINTITKEAEQNKQLIYATIELTNHCNFRCKHCYLGSKEKKQELTVDNIKKLVRDLKKEGCISLILTGGEVFMHPNFKEIYSDIKKQGFLVSIFTNGYLLNNEIIEFLSINPPMMIEISLYGIDDQSYEQFTGIKKGYTKVLNNIKKLQKAGLKIRLKTVLLKNTINQIAAMATLANKLNIDFRWDYYVINSLYDNNEQIEHCNLSAEEIFEMIKKDEHKLKLFTTAIKEKTTNNNLLYKCGAGVTNIYIDSKYNLNICAIARIPSYDLNRGTLREGLKVIRQYGLKTMPRNFKCKDCNLIQICRYCPSKFYLANKDFYTPIDKYCQLAKLLNTYLDEKEKVK